MQGNNPRVAGGSEAAFRPPGVVPETLYFYAITMPVAAAASVLSNPGVSEDPTRAGVSDFSRCIASLVLRWNAADSGLAPIV